MCNINRKILTTKGGNMKRLIVGMVLVVSMLVAVQVRAQMIEDWFRTNIDASVGIGYVYPLEKFATIGKMDVIELADGMVNVGLVVALPISEESVDSAEVLGGIGATFNLNAVVEEAGGSLLLPYGLEIGGSVLVDLQDFNELDVHYGVFLIREF